MSQDKSEGEEEGRVVETDYRNQTKVLLRGSFHRKDKVKRIAVGGGGGGVVPLQWGRMVCFIDKNTIRNLFKIHNFYLF